MSQHDESPREIEHNIDVTRARIVDTLDALQAKVSPGEILDHTLTQFKKGGAEIAENFSRAVRENPLPAALLGVSLLWLMRGTSHAAAARREWDAAIDPAQEDGLWTGEPNQAAGGGRLSHMAETAREGLEEVRHRVEDVGRRAEEIRRRVEHGARDLREQGSRAVQSTARAARDSADYAARHPMVLGLLGVSLGAAIGAFMLTTRRGQELSREARERAREAVEHGRETARDLSRQARDAAEHTRQSAHEMAEQARDTARHTRDAARDLAEQAREQARHAADDVQERMRDIRQAVGSKAGDGPDRGWSGAGAGGAPGESGMDKTGAISASSEPEAGAQGARSDSSGNGTSSAPGQTRH